MEAQPRAAFVALDHLLCLGRLSYICQRWLLVGYFLSHGARTGSYALFLELSPLSIDWAP